MRVRRGLREGKIGRSVERAVVMGRIVGEARDLEQRQHHADIARVEDHLAAMPSRQPRRPEVAVMLKDCSGLP